MKTVKYNLDSFSPQYPLEKIANPEEILFLDIETTGFSSKASYLYLIGCAYYKTGLWHTIQWFAEKYEEEAEIIREFFQFAGSYSCIVHFNGNTFDLPFILQKCKQHELTYDFDAYECIDLYKRISPCKFVLKLPNCKQKTLEQFLGIDRKDVFSGGELIGLYHDYVKMPTDFTQRAIIQHNHDDLLGMLEILPLLSYYDLFTENVKAKKVQANYYKALDGSRHMELLMMLNLPTALPRPISACAGNCYFSAEGSEGSLKVPVYEEEMKYYYANYKDYYYLPAEDVALHKSVASFVDPEHRIQAAAATCYTRKQSQYLPQWGMFREPFFKRDYKSRELFFELTEELKRDRAAFTDYANHVLAMIASIY